ncbi:M1 family metallopeptidase [Desulfurivibrio dismutans]|uniref:M1 family metallopeptidase n=1 Tax=Desulfurivibrio dismutans TaxID=1398908 RepID=UPI0023DB9868|nr:M1 family aminopeptidase [Desulfurivibrio alkaliphilus]MDF1614033.1 M1 family aminopeptidase [Desulfurivibrio alkaliphilus]
MNRPRSFVALVCTLTLLLLAGPAPGGSPATDDPNRLHYEILATLEPDRHRLQARVAITLPPDYPRQFDLALHPGLNPVAEHPEVELTPRNSPDPGSERGQTAAHRPERFTINLPPDLDTFVLLYDGEIHHPLGFAGQEYARGVRHTAGRIDPDGIYLTPGTFWYPRPTGAHVVSFRLRAVLPAGWTAVSQGRRHQPRPEVTDNETVWEELNPQQGVFLVADRYSVYEEESDGVARQVFLRQPDPELARRYLDATTEYLQLYSQMIGPYPYAKFAMVENAWESGFGMPSFTLLGSRVIHLPFILRTSYPHEILHNWWGNGVFTDYARGNWSEGLTAHLADHLLMARQGRGMEYRLRVLQKYADYAAGGRDFPLRRFTARHSPAGEAVGYGKGLMFFHMLEQKLGHELFQTALADFYRQYLFQVASFDDLQHRFEQTTEQDLNVFFRQWLERPGAPELVMEAVQVEEHDQGWRLAATFGQRQSDPPYRLQLPVAVTLENEKEPRRFLVPLTDRRVDWRADFAQRPRHLALDPDFDLFRRLDQREIPAVFSRLFGAEEDLLVILPGREQPLLPTYRELARALGSFGSAGVEIVLDHELEELPPTRESIILGWENRFQPETGRALAQFGAELLEVGREPAAATAPGALQVDEQAFSRIGHAFALALPHPDNPDGTIGWIALDRPAMLAGVIRRLPHYHSYGALVFQGDQAENIFRHRWPAHASPLHRDL